MNRLSIVLLFSAGVFAQVPDTDLRNTHIPNTDTHFTMPVYRTLGEWEAHAAHLRKQILSAAGLDPMPEKTPLHPQIFGRIENKDYSIEKVLLETMPGYYLGGNLYRPLGRSGKLPAVATPHGHWAYGRLENQPLASVPARSINLARQGYVVFSYDMVGYNDTIQTPHTFGGPREQLWGFGPLGLQLWNSIRVVDFLTSLPEVDGKRIGVTGASGGGTQTILLAAVDPRVTVSAPVNMISAIMQGGCQCENAPGLRFDTFNVEIGALAAPRPMLMVAATGDWTKNTPNEEYPAVRHIYELYGKAENLEMVQIDAPHNYNQASREAMYRFFAKHLLGARDAGAENYRERSARIEKLQDMLALDNRTLPEGALDYQGIVEQWIGAAKKQNQAITDGAGMRGRLMPALGAEWPERVLSEREGEHIVLSRAGRGDRVAAIRVEGRGPEMIVVHSDGAEAGRAMVEAGRAALLVTVFQTGNAAAPRDRSHPHFLTFNRTDDANRVQDILTALAYVKRQGVELKCSGKAAVWCTFAAAVAPMKVKLDAPLGGFAGTDEDYIHWFFVPGIERAGGLEAALRLVGR